ncbi:MAG: right-handed parallel beta-helix repeat-containing protein [Pseudarthrobacter sp.]|nr:right-handed parallel beta-helix repeat-containing protein [Pseudarthrobacter sp.]
MAALSAGIPGMIARAPEPDPSPAPAAAPSPAYANARFVSSSGNDANPGTEAAPWQSLARVTSALESGEVGRGDAVLLRRGEVFPGSLQMPVLKGAAGVFTLASYGTGAPPQINGYKVSNDAWTPYGPGIWKLDLRPGSGQFSGNTDGASTNVGFLKAGGTIHGWKRWSVAALAQDWDFYSDDAFVYVKLAASPGAGVEIAVKQEGLRPASNTTASDLHILGHGGHGVRTYGIRDAAITNCLIEEIGGSRLKDTTRYGNGVEVWIGCSNVLVQGNTIRQTYDTATTMQGNVEGSRVAWTDCRFVGNTIENCNQSFEVWSHGIPAAGTGHIRCAFTDNECRDAGISWAANIRPDQAGMGTHLLTYDVQLPCDIEIARNRFIGAKDNFVRSSGNRQIPAGIRTHSNTISLASGQKIAYQNPETIEQLDAWRSRTGNEQG